MKQNNFISKSSLVQKNARLLKTITCQCDASKHIITFSKQSYLKKETVRVIDQKKQNFLVAFNKQKMIYIRVFTKLMTLKI